MLMPASLATPMPIASIRALEKEGLAKGLPLMQRAGTSAARFLHNRIPRASQVLALAGPGNNGGDALVAARELKALGHELIVVMPEHVAKAPADAQQARLDWLACGGILVQDLPGHFSEAVIDGLFGIGLSRQLADPWQTIIDTVNGWQTQVLALDIPSGLAADTGQPLGRPLQATWTLAFIAPSLAFDRENSRRYFGECFVEDLDLQAGSDGKSP